MENKSNVNHTQQYEPPKTPSDWSEAGKKFVVQLTEILDDIYRRFGRLRLEDLAPGVRKTIKDTAGNVLEIRQTAEGLALTVTDVKGKLTEIKVTTDGIQAAVDGGRLVFSGSGLTILNSNGDAVFQQDMATGDVVLTGIIRALGGVIGGFTIGENKLYNGESLVLDPVNGMVRMGDFTLTDDAEYGPLASAVGGLRLAIGRAIYMVLAEGRIDAMFPLTALYGLFVDPNVTTSQAPNAYIDPVTGQFKRSTSGGGTPGTSLGASMNTHGNSFTVGNGVWITADVSGGTAPYSYAYAVSVGGGGYSAIAGSAASVTYYPQNAGSYRFRLIVSDSAGNSTTIYSDLISVTQAQSSLSVSVSADRSNLTPPGMVTWSVAIMGGSGDYACTITVYRDGNYVDHGEGTRMGVYITQPGTYYASAAVTDLGGSEAKQAQGGTVVVGSLVQYARTTGTNVIMRSGPGTGYGEVTRVPASGTQVQVTGSLTSGFYPVYWNGHSGYMSAQYLQLI